MAILSFDHVSMQYPGVLACDDVSLSIQKGEIFALVGENGAGKSTLMNLLYGLIKPTLGHMTIQGKPISNHHSPQEAMALGVSMVHQHFKLVPSFSVAKNVLLGHEPKKHGIFYDEAAAIREVQRLSDTYHLPLCPTDIVQDLSVGLQQRVEILKALRCGADVLILDEPTAVLTPQESDELFLVVRKMVKEQGMTVILITHKLPEVMSISDRVGVMRHGKLIQTLHTAQTSEQALASLMVGREVIFPSLRNDQPRGEAVLSLSGVSAQNDRGLHALSDLSLTVHAGEIVGICGVEGNGQTELAECIMGLRSLTHGHILLSGQDVTGNNPKEMRQKGIAYVPEDRIATGSDIHASIADNLILGRQQTPAFSLFGVHLKRKAINDHAKKQVSTFDIRTPSIHTLTGSLSGGNMQKVVIAREFDFGAPAMLICQPTRGVDIGAMEAIHEAIIQKRNEGCAILLISADLDELFRLSDRLVTLFEGRITGDFASGTVSRDKIGQAMTGATQEVTD